MKKVVIYPGRFQPMLAHHAEVFRQLQAQFPDAEVYIGTSDKTELPNSPFNFKEKQLIAQSLGIDPKRVLKANRPYNQEDYAEYFDNERTVIIFAVGEKDVERFPFSNVDPKTGLDMTVRGDPRPKYYQKINTYNASPLPMKQRGYVTVAPTVMAGTQAASASSFRTAMANAPDKQAAKEVFTAQFGQFNNKVFNLIYNKIAGTQMNEQINQMRKLAGLPPLAESAPVEFSAQLDPKQAQFVEPTKASMRFSIANRFPKGADLEDPKVKQEQFLNALLRSPEALLGEINERLDPKDPASLAIGDKIDQIQSQLMKSGGKLNALPQEDKEFVLELAGEAVKRMSLVAGDNSPAYDPSAELESVNLNMVRESYGVMEGSAGAVYDALRRRVLSQHMDLLTDYGIEAVLAAIKDVSSRFDFKDLEEIGSSDVSAWMGWVRDNLAAGEYGPKREPKPVKLGPPEHWDSSRVGEPSKWNPEPGKVQYLTRLGDIEEGADDVLADEFEDNRVRTIYNQDGVEITSTTEPDDDDEGSYIQVYVNGEFVADGDYDPHSGFWFSGFERDGGSMSFDTPAEIAQYFVDRFAEGMGSTVNEAKKVPANYGALMARKKRQANKNDKPDFADVDKDGNKAEPMKKAAKDAKLDEVSDDTLRSYRVKAKKDANNLYHNARDTSMYSKEPDKGKKAFAMMKQSKKRQAGVKKASDRLGVTIYDESLREGEDSAKLTASQRKQLQKITKGQSLNLCAWATKVLDKGTISSAEAKKLANLMSEKSKVSESVKLSEGTMNQGIFDRNPKRAMTALQGLNNVLRDALPASQAGDILYRYVFDDALYDIIDNAAMLDHTVDMRSVAGFMSRIKYLRSEAEKDLRGGLDEVAPLVPLAVGAVARGVAGRMGASALGQAATSIATNAAVSKALDKATPVEEDDDDLDFDFDLGPVPADKDAEANNPNIKFKDIDEENDPQLAAEIRQLVQDIVDNQVDLYNVYANPQGPAQQALHPTLAKYYDTIASTHRLHPDDDFEQILDGVADWLMNDFLSGEYDAVTEADASEKDVAKNVAAKRQSYDRRERALGANWTKHSAHRNADEKMLKQLHKDADTVFSIAMADVKNTPVAKFLKKRKGDGAVRTESNINESEWSEIWYKGKRVGYVSDEHEYTTRSQRANSDFDLDDLEPAQISRILKKLGVNPVSEADQIDEVGTGKKMAVAYRAGKRYVDAKKQDDYLTKIGAHSLVAADVSDKKKHINTIKRSGAMGKLAGIAGAVKKTFEAEDDQWYLVTDDADLVYAITADDLEMGTNVLASGTRAEMEELRDSGEYGAPGMSVDTQEEGNVMEQTIAELRKLAGL